MGINTSAELDIFDCTLGERGLGEFEHEAQHGPPPGPYVAPSRERTWPFAVPVVIAAALVGAALSWAGMGRSEVVVARPLPAAQPPSTSPTPISPVARVAPAAAAVSRPAPVKPAAVPQPAPVAVDATIEPTLAMVSRAYRALDASSLTAVWPGADTASLSE